MVAFASSALDQIGPLTKSVEDSATLLQVSPARTKRDSTCLEAPVPDYRASLQDTARTARPADRPARGFRRGL
ncbi:MAG: hypothetical protein R3F31_20660 [Verrucomicrobiales bacterium]